MSVGQLQPPAADLFIAIAGLQPRPPEHNLFLQRCLVELVNRGLAPYRVGYGPATVGEARARLRELVLAGIVTLDVEGSPAGRRLSMRIHPKEMSNDYAR